ncbi:hypothetical protein V1264_003881 [Littorina saxatilis]|uniref:Metalloendopeptidase n=1 Tax=Littorina saxatilis TaxID=31220 RepID=A0AAN9B109_9CAEN
MTQGSHWPRGIVPFDFNPSLSDYYVKEALAAMTKFHKYTCIRFVPWVKEVTKAKYDLSLESHVTITKKDSTCAAVQGNVRSASGQFNSCCSRGTCVHELGHTLGLWHEHQNPWQDDVMKKDWAKIDLVDGWTYRTREPHGLDVYQYDTASSMHYGGSAFKILYEDLRPLISFSNQYYMYKDTSTFHSCKEHYCSGVSQQCHNDGFLTLVDDQCSCLCPPGLDPTTGCTTVVKQVTTSSQWPKGLYAIMSPSTGCPGNNEEFSRGSWAHKGEGGNSISDYFNLAGKFESDTFEYEFCVKNDNSGSTGPAWETGRYCILRVGGACPDGMSAWD